MLNHVGPAAESPCLLLHVNGRTLAPEVWVSMTLLGAIRAESLFACVYPYFLHPE